MKTAVLELLTSRVCHDLVSPISAIHNGIEFMEEMGVDMGDDAMELLSHSSAMASARLQAFRMAYGAGGRDPSIEPKDIHKIFGNMIALDGKVTQDWDPHGDLGFGEDAPPPGYCKMLLGMLMLAMEALPKGGAVKAESAGPGQTRIIAEGDGATLRDYTEESLSHLLPVDDLDPRLVHAYVLSALAEDYGFTVRIEAETEGRVTFLLGQ